MKFVPIALFCFCCLSCFAQFSSGDVTVWGDIMEGFSDGTRIVKGNLKALQNEQVLTGDWGKYSEKTQIVEAYGKVMLEDPSYTLTCGMVIAYFSENRGVAKQNPVVIEKVPDKESSMEVGVRTPVKERYLKLSGTEITSFFEEDRLVARDNVHVYELYFPQFLKPGESEIASKMTCDFLEMFLKENKSIGRGNVVMESESITAFGEEAVYYHDEEKLIITGNARAHQKIEGSKQQNTVSGEKLVYFVKTGRIVVLKARADVFPATQGSSSGKTVN